MKPLTFFAHLGTHKSPKMYPKRDKRINFEYYEFFSFKSFIIIIGDLGQAIP